MKNASAGVVLALVGALVAGCSSDTSSEPGALQEGGTGGKVSAGGGSGAGGKLGTGGSSGAGGATTHVDGGAAGKSAGGATDAGADATPGTGGSRGTPDSGNDAATGTTTTDAGAADTGTTDSGGDAALVTAVTDVGTPVAGVPVASASIGAAGGTIASGDGQVLLTVPAGALTAATAIGIQAITNNAPGHTGYAYRFTPDALVFAKPVTIAFKPTYGQLEGSSVDHVQLAFQDAQRRWQLLPVTAGTGTVTASTTHFTDYAFLLNLALSGTDALFAGQATTFKVIEVPGNAGYAAEVNVVKTGNPTWLLDGSTLGNGSDGKLEPLANAAAYTAPAQIPATNPVAVSVSFTSQHGAKVTLVQQVHILAHKYRFDVTLTNDMTCTGGAGYSFDYGTTGSIDLTLNGTFDVTSGNPSAAVTPTISAITVCAGICSATAEPAKTTGITLTTVAGGWEPALHRLWLQPRGVASGMPSFNLDCGTAGSHEVLAAGNPWNTPGYLGYLEGKNAETASQIITLPSGMAGPSFKLTVLQP